ncbi:MAG: hypothetical protein AAF348_01330 [Bacteroidota bacterium]
MRQFTLRLCILATTLLSIISCNREVAFDAILVQGPAPTELQANIAFNNEEPPFSVTVSPTAQGATAFEVTSGLPGAVAEIIGIQQSLTFSYPESDENFFVTIRAIAANGMVTEQQFEIVPPADPCTQIFSAPASWDNGNDPAFTFGFGNIESPTVVENPDPSGANPEVSNVLQIIDSGGDPFDGYGIQMNGDINFAAEDKVVRLLFWSEFEVPVRLEIKQEPDNTSERGVEVTLIHGGNGWEELRFDFNDGLANFSGGGGEALGIADGAPFVPTGIYIRAQMTIGAGDADVAGTYYLDDLGICPDGGAAPPATPVEPDPCASIFESPVTLENGESFFGFNGVDVQVIPNPDLSGANPDASNVLEIVQDGGGNFDGFGTVLDPPADFSDDDKEVRVLMWSDAVVTVRLNMQQNPTNNETEREVEVAVEHGGTGWEELRFDFANAVAGFADGGEALGVPNGEALAPTGQYNQPTFFIGPGEDVSGTFYIDNLGSCPE